MTRGFPRSRGSSALTVTRIAFVDSLRLLAAMLVVFQHLGERHRGPIVDALLALGPGVLGVVLFFLVSGYVIPISVRGGLDLRTFMIRRVFRIYPLFLVALAVVGIGGMTGLLDQWLFLRTADLPLWAANLLLVQDFVGQGAILGVSWTLVIELIWYAAFAATMAIWPRQAARILSIAAPVLLVALALLSLALQMRVPLGRPAMIYAAILGFQFYRYDSGHISGGALGWNCAAFLLVTGFTNSVAFGVFAHPHITLGQALGPWFFAPLLFLAILLPAYVRNHAWLNDGLLPRIGAVSYSIYLLHPIANAAADQHVSERFAVIAALVFTAVLAFAGYRFVERPGIALGRMLAARISPARASGLARSA